MWPSLVLLSRNRIFADCSARKEADGMIIRHIVIKMYYMLILYYEALERNVNLSQVYSVFKKQIQAPERNGTSERGSDGTGITIPRFDSSSFFLVPDAPSTSLLFSSAVFPSTCIAFQIPTQITSLSFLSSISFLPPACSSSPHATSSPLSLVSSPVMLQNHTLVPGKRDTSASS